MKTISIMQPYFFPYIGYWQLIKASSIFVVYDNIQYTKKGWINRNRFLQNNTDAYFTLPLKKQSDFLNINMRSIAADFDKEKLFCKIQFAYKNAPYFNETINLFEEILKNPSDNLFEYIYNSISIINRKLNIDTKVIVSSEIPIDHNLKSENKVLAICQYLNAQTYINPIGGLSLYDKKAFNEKNIDLKFLKSDLIEYKQFNNEFIPWLSILDIMMFNNNEEIQKMLNAYSFV